MLAADEPRDYVVATGKAHTVREFAERAFAAVSLDWRAHVRADAELARREKLEVSSAMRRWPGSSADGRRP
jgi:GDPmannose 4,6-dehydratase